MKLSILGLALIVPVLWLSGCATANGPPFVLQPAVPDQATIYAFRPASIVGGGNSDIVAVNDHFIGRVNSGTYAVYRTDPGMIRITRKAGSLWGSGDQGGWGLGALVGALDGYNEVASFEAKAGGIYFVQFSEGVLVANDEALKLMDGLEDITPTK
jgi:hypothetical protein